MPNRKVVSLHFSSSSYSKHSAASRCMYLLRKHLNPLHITTHTHHQSPPAPQSECSLWETPLHSVRGMKGHKVTFTMLPANRSSSSPSFNDKILNSITMYNTDYTFINKIGEVFHNCTLHSCRVNFYCFSTTWPTLGQSCRTLVMWSFPPEPRVQMIRCLEKRKHCLSPSFFRDKEPSRPRVIFPFSLIGTWIREPMESCTEAQKHTHTGTRKTHKQILNMLSFHT